MDEVCSICGANEPGDLCGNCLGNVNYKLTAKAILAEVRSPHASLAEWASTTDAKKLSIYEPGVKGAFKKIFESHPGYVTSAYRPHNLNGRHRKEDLNKLTFSDGHFDIVIISDTLRFIPDPWKALYEIKRVLRYGGSVFLNEQFQKNRNAKSVSRARVNGKGETEILLHPEIRVEGPDGGGEADLVYTDFGVRHLLVIADSMGMGHSVTSSGDHYCVTLYKMPAGAVPRTHF